MIKYLYITAIFVFFSVIALPGMIAAVGGYGRRNTDYAVIEDSKEEETEVINAVDFEEKINKYEEMTRNGKDNSFEEYIKGVVAAEMPVRFETEALKAQAVAARTYAVRNCGDIYNIDPGSLGQAYISVDEMKKNWGENFDEYYGKICDAVSETRGLIMVYEDEPILAAFYSTSAGKTEVAENVWGSQLPYIKSVDSQLDKKAPNYESKASFSYERAAEILRGYDNNITGSDREIIDSIEITERTEAGYVKYITVCGIAVRGTKIRTMFGLRSNCFTIDRDGENIVFTTKGFGHGVGMSQYGAEFMAEEGKSFSEILNHYYKDITIRSY